MLLSTSQGWAKAPHWEKLWSTSITAPDYSTPSGLHHSTVAYIEYRSPVVSYPGTQQSVSWCKCWIAFSQGLARHYWDLKSGLLRCDFGHCCWWFLILILIMLESGLVLLLIESYSLLYRMISIMRLPWLISIYNTWNAFWLSTLALSNRIPCHCNTISRPQLLTFGWRIEYSEKIPGREPFQTLVYLPWSIWSHQFMARRILRWPLFTVAGPIRESSAFCRIGYISILIFWLVLGALILAFRTLHSLSGDL